MDGLRDYYHFNKKMGYLYYISKVIKYASVCVCRFRVNQNDNKVKNLIDTWHLAEGTYSNGVFVFVKRRKFVGKPVS